MRRPAAAAFAFCLRPGTRPFRFYPSPIGREGKTLSGKGLYCLHKQLNEALQQSAIRNIIQLQFSFECLSCITLMAFFTTLIMSLFYRYFVPTTQFFYLIIVFLLLTFRTAFPPLCQRPFNNVSEDLSITLVKTFQQHYQSLFNSTDYIIIGNL